MENEEKTYLQPGQVAISRETFDEFKKMVPELVEMRARIKALEEMEKSYKAISDWLIYFKVHLELIYYCVIKFTGTFGLNNKENTMIRPEILSGTESPTGGILKQITQLSMDAAVAEFNPAKKREMEQRFVFFQYLPAVAQFTEQQRTLSVTVPDHLLKQLPAEVQQVIVNPPKPALPPAV